MADQFVDPVGPACFEGIVDGGEEQLLGCERVVVLVADQFLEAGGHVGDPQGPELVVVVAGEHRSPSLGVVVGAVHQRPRRLGGRRVGGVLAVRRCGPHRDRFLGVGLDAGHEPFQCRVGGVGADVE